MTRLAQERREAFLSLYGGAVNAEWVLPKLLQIFEEAPEVYAAAAHELEAMDWLNWRLTGRLNRSAMGLGYKAFYQNGSFPAEAYFAALAPGALPPSAGTSSLGRYFCPENAWEG